MPRPASRSTRLLAALLSVQLVAGLVAVVVLRPERDVPAQPTSALRGRATVSEDTSRADAVRSLLAARADAIARRDRAAWLATVDPQAPAFATRQARLFDALRQVPVAGWTYELDTSSQQPADERLDRVRGLGWWAPAVTLRYRLAGYDLTPTAEPQRLTFVPRGDRWYIAADDDFAEKTTRGLWDGGPVVAVRGKASLVLGHPSAGRLLRTVADNVDAAVPRVTAAWGTAWARKVVVLVPSSQAELQRLVGGTGDYSRIAAVATAELTRGSGGYLPVGDRIIVNPPNFAKLGPVGRRVVLTHEVTHVATRAATGPMTPTWLVEGFADYVGYGGVDLPYRVTAQELRADVRRGRIPDALPTDADFAGSNPELAQVYEQAWLAVVLLARRYGKDAPLRLYRVVGRGEMADDALRSLFGTDLRRFTQEWRRDLPVRLR